MLRDFLLSLSLANICFYNVWAQFFYKRLYFLKNLPTANSYLALIINELLVTGFFMLAMQLTRKFANQPLKKVIKFFVCLALLSFLYAIAIKFKTQINLNLFKILLLGVTAFLISRRLMYKTTLKVFLLLTPFAFIILFQAAGGFVHEITKPKPAAVPVQTLFSVAENQPRVLWLIFDELDQAITFEYQAEGLKLPNFESFKQQSFYAVNAIAPSNLTLGSIPALIDGKRVVESKRTGIDKLEITYKEAEKPVYWGSQPNVFSKARQLMVNTALAGEYIPYSRMIGKDLSYCFWAPMRYDFTSSEDTLLANIKTQAYGLMWSPYLNYEEHRLAHVQIFEAAQDIVADRRYGLMFCHFAIPHGPYFRTRYIHNTQKEGYLELLMLADESFGELRRILEHEGLWDKTTVLLSSDHWFRGKRFDGRKNEHRVPFVLKMAGHQRFVEYQQPFNTVLTQEMILEILSGKLKTPEQVSNWLDEHRTEMTAPEFVKSDD